MLQYFILILCFLFISNACGGEKELKKRLTKIIKPKESLDLILLEKSPFAEKFKPYIQWPRNIDESLQALKIVKKPNIKMARPNMSTVKLQHYQDFQEHIYKYYKEKRAYMLIGGSILETTYLMELNPRNKASILKRINKEKKRLPFTSPLHKFFSPREINYFQTVGKFLCGGNLIGRNKREMEGLVRGLKKQFSESVNIRMQQAEDAEKLFWQDKNLASDKIVFRIDFPDKRYIQAHYVAPRDEAIVLRPTIRYYDRVPQTFFNIPNLYMKGAIELTLDCNLNFGWRGFLNLKKVINPFKALKKFVIFDKNAKIFKTISAEEPRRVAEAIYSKSEIEELKREAPKFKKDFVKMAVIDTGIDYNHPILAHKILEVSDVYSKIQMEEKERKLKQAYAANKFLTGLLRKKELSPEARARLQQRKKRIDEVRLNLQIDLSFGWNGFFKNSMAFDGSDLLLNGMIYLNRGRGETIGHGTHVAGIAAKGDAIKIIPIRAHLGRFKQKEIMFDRLTKSLEDAARVIRSKKPEIVNMSMGGPNKIPWMPMLKAMKDNPNTLFFYSAGNNRLKLKPDPYPNELGKNDKSDRWAKETLKWPPSFMATNQIVVGSVNGLPGIVESVKYSGFSDYGVKVVDIAAPGEQIISAQIGRGTKEMTGSSQAAPFAANVAAKMLLVNPKLNPIQLKQILLSTGTKLVQLKDKVRCSCVINPDAAIKRAAEAAQ